MNINDTKFDLNDVLIEPRKNTSIQSRFTEITSTYGLFDSKQNVEKHYPIFTAPMDTVVDLKNMATYRKAKIPVVLPRTVTFDDYVKQITPNGEFNYEPNNFPYMTFMSFGLKDFIKHYCENKYWYSPKFVLIDTANGHLYDIMDAVKLARKNFPNIIIMVGNVANPETYKWYAESGLVNLVRVGIGNGNGCLTTQQTGVGYPMASLIRECYEIKKKIKGESPLIVADGGMKSYSDIIKAVGLGADYVMAGSIFNVALESSGKNYLFGINIFPTLAKLLYSWGLPVKKKFYGMSTKTAQKKIGNDNIKTSEGVVRYRRIEYTLNKWVENFDHYLRSAMSYANARSLYEFIGETNFNLISNNAKSRFKK